MKPYYELHITMEEPKERAPEVVCALESYTGWPWKFSMITDDPILGPGMKMYATTHVSEDKGEAWISLCLGTCVNYLRDTCNLNVIRQKIEHVTYDAIKGRDF